MALWQKLWLLFTVISTVVTVLQVATILAIGEEPPDRVWKPILLGIAVPALLYLVLWGWVRLRKR
jgi:hypothetical protein